MGHLIAGMWHVASHFHISLKFSARGPSKPIQSVPNPWSKIGALAFTSNWVSARSWQLHKDMALRSNLVSILWYHDVPCTFWWLANTNFHVNICKLSSVKLFWGFYSIGPAKHRRVPACHAPAFSQARVTALKLISWDRHGKLGRKFSMDEVWWGT